MEEQPDLFTVTFSGPTSGWIDCSVATLSASLLIHASYIGGPFHGMMRWLEDIVSGQEESTWYIDEESRHVEWIFTQCENSLGQLEIADTSDQERRLSARLTLKQLVFTLYNSFRTFVTSRRYDRDEWEEKSLGEYLSEYLKLDNEALKERLVRYSGRALQQSSWQVYPRYENLYPVGATDRAVYSTDEQGRTIITQWGKSAVIHTPDEEYFNSEASDRFFNENYVPSYSHDPLKAVAHEQSIAIPVYQELPERYDDASPEERMTLLDSFLDVNINKYDGGRLHEMRSEIVEAWLGKD